MKYLFLFLLVLHGIIHLPGFLKAFRLAEFEQLHIPISKPAGIFWLLAGLLFLAAAVLFITKNDLWMYPAVAAVFVSSVLIIMVWKDAKFGMIPNIIILAVATVSLSSARLEKKILAERTEILSAADSQNIPLFTEADAGALPEPVKKWLRRSGVIDRPVIKTARVHQTAQMKMKPGQEDWYDAESEQYITTESPAFIWTVRMKMSPVMNIRGRDKFTNGKGAMLIRMNSLLNIVNETGEKLDEGALQRYLGEMVWYPTMATSPFITWEAIDDHSARATLSYKGTKGSGTFYFNDEGDFVKFSAMRYKGNEPDAKRYEWIITVDKYDTFEGIRVPSELQATWQLEDGAWTWLKMRVDSVGYNM